MNDSYLAHHGIKGQKWGVRRFQNEDGSLTNAGRKRYGSSSSSKLSGKSRNNTSVDPAEKERIDAMRRYNNAREVEGKYYQNKFNEDKTTSRLKVTKAVSDATNQSLNSFKDAYRKANQASVSYDTSSMSTKELQEVVNRMNLEDNYARLMNNRRTISKGEQYVNATVDTITTIASIAGLAATTALAFRQLKAPKIYG